MTTVHVSLTRDDGTATTAATGVLEWEPTTRRESGDDVILPQGFVARLVAGEATVTVEHSDGLTWCWRVTERVKDGTVRYVAVPDSAETVEYTDLVDVDPDTLAAWEPTMAAVYQDALDLKANTADLGTAAAADTGDFATAAQGDTADAALPAADLDAAVTVVDANAASALRVQQDARLSDTYAAQADFRVQDAGGVGTSGDVIVIGDVNAVATDLGMAGVIAGGKPNYENVIGAATTDNVDTVNSNLPTATGTGADFSFIIGGYDNVNNGNACIISGFHCKIESGSTHNVISGGSKHVIPTAVNYSTIGGGTQNTTTADFGTVGGGVFNSAAGAATVCGGYQNAASNTNATANGGRENTASGTYSTIGGGYQNAAAGQSSVVAGGANGSASVNYATIGGGYLNQATGLYSTIPGGLQNTASGSAAVAMGRENSASADNSVAVGRGSSASFSGAVAHSASVFATQGDAQTIRVISRRQTTNASATEIYVAGGSQRLVLPDHTTWAFRSTVVARSTAGESAAYEITGVIDRGDGAATTALVGTPTMTVLGEDVAGWDVSITALASTIGCLRIMVTGEVDKTIRWVASTAITAVTNPAA